MQLHTHLDNSTPFPVGISVRIEAAKNELQKTICQLLISHKHKLSRCECKVGKQPA